MTTIKKHINLANILLFFLILSTSSIRAEVYISLAPALVEIDTDNASTRPSLVDLRIGYEYHAHQLELAIMSSISDDNLNQLTVDVPSVNSIFYRYSPHENEQIKMHFILGASQIDVDSTYPNIADTTDTFNGVSFGIGFEEAFKSIPQLKLKLDLLRLYNGDSLDVNLLSIGVRYVF